MCGIFACFNDDSTKDYRSYFERLKHRGPDNSTYQTIDSYFQIGFHRLAIVDPFENSNQPFISDDWVVVCNGEIYNYKSLVHDFNLSTKLTTGSDCEVILALLNHLSPRLIAEALDAEFVFIAYNKKTKNCYVARDTYGVRPLFYGRSSNSWYFASECKALAFLQDVKPFPPHYLLQISPTHPTWISYSEHIKLTNNSSNIYNNINNLLHKAVQKRLQSDQPLGCFLSGGLDSSLVASIAQNNYPNLQFFTIGLENSVDIEAAIKVIDFLKVPKHNHHVIYFTVEEGFNALKDVIYHLETYDITTIRASVPQYLLSKYIKKNTNIKVLLSGEGSDELFAGYQYSKLAPSPSELRQDTIRLLRELYLFDNLRTDRTTSAFGLEVRVPFLDKELVSYVLSLDDKLRMCNTQKMEKTLLRDSFRYENLLPNDILYRRKEAFSDAVSASVGKSWYEMLSDLIDNVVDDNEFINNKFTVNKPLTKEAYYYRKIFTELFGDDRYNLIPHFWLPKWSGDISDPSAKVLQCYKN